MDNQEQDQDHNQSENYMRIHVHILCDILVEISRWCGYHLEQRAVEQGITHAITLIQNFAGLKELLRNVLSEADGRGIEDVLSLLQNRREDIVRMCQDNEAFAEYRKKLPKDSESGSAGSRLAAKVVSRPTFILFMKKVTKKTVKNSYSTGFKILGVRLGLFATKKVVVKQSTKVIVAAANPVGFVADLAQAGCEVAGYNGIGKTVGATGNVAAGAMMGSIGGPPGVLMGAAGGLLLWGIGEAIGLGFDKFTTQTSSTTTEEPVMIYLD